MIVVSRNIDEALDTAQELIHVHAQAVDEVFQILHRPLVLTGDILNRIGNGLIDRAVVGERLADAVLHALREGGVRLVVFDLGIFERFEPALDVGQRTVGVGLAVEGIDLLLQILDFEIEHILLDEVIFRQDRLHRFAQRVLHRLLALADRLLYGGQRRIIGQFGVGHVTFERRSQPFGRNVVGLDLVEQLRQTLDRRLGGVGRLGVALGQVVRQRTLHGVDFILQTRAGAFERLDPLLQLALIAFERLDLFFQRFDFRCGGRLSQLLLQLSDLSGLRLGFALQRLDFVLQARINPVQPVDRILQRLHLLLHGSNLPRRQLVDPVVQTRDVVIVVLATDSGYHRSDKEQR